MGHRTCTKHGRAPAGTEVRCCLAAVLQEHREAALFVALVEGACANHRRKPVGKPLLSDLTAIGAAIDEPGECIKQRSNEVD
jgi:hypothetical protein